MGKVSEKEYVTESLGYIPETNTTFWIDYEKWKLPSCIRHFVTPWNYPGQNTGVGSLSLLQRIFPTQRSNPGLPHCRQILYQLSHKGNPRILEWVAYPFSSGSSWPRNWTRVSCVAGRFFTNWAIKELNNKSLPIYRWGHLFPWPRHTLGLRIPNIWSPSITSF